MTFEKICVVGLGYIGLPTAALFASRKIPVTGVDTNREVVETINKGEIHILEPDLDVAVHDAVNRGYLRAAVQPEPADAFLIAVPTPLTERREVDLGYVEEAARTLAQVLKQGDLVVLESTCPVGTTGTVARLMADLRPDLRFPGNSAGPGRREERLDINVAHCPERVLPGRIMRELLTNDRVVGGLTAGCADRAIELYGLIVEGNCVATTARTAELTKLAENSFRDLNIAFANELSMICDRLGIDAWEMIDLANRHPRVNILQPGPGVGGHCIAVDPWCIINSAPEESRLIRMAREVNDSKPGHVVGQIMEAAGAFEEPAIACLGLSFKADIDDLRESPSLEIVKALASCQAGRILVCEPNIDSLPDSLAGIENVSWADDPAQAVDAADVVALLVDHKEFLSLGPRLLKNKPLIDTRGWSWNRGWRNNDKP